MRAKIIRAIALGIARALDRIRARFGLPDYVTCFVCKQQHVVDADILGFKLFTCDAM